MKLALDGRLDDGGRRHHRLAVGSHSVEVDTYPIDCFELNTDCVESNDELYSLERNLNNLLEIHWNELEMC